MSIVRHYVQTCQLEKFSVKPKNQLAVRVRLGHTIQCKLSSKIDGANWSKEELYAYLCTTKYGLLFESDKTHI